MKITKIKVKNYRLLKNFSIDLEEELSLIVGKNNCGKTSLLSIMNKSINSDKFLFDDFNLDFKAELEKLIEKHMSKETEKEYKPVGITLKLFIEYNENDNLANISKFMMDLDPDNKTIVLLFEYILTLDKLKQLREDFKKFKNSNRDLDYFLQKKHSNYFRVCKKTIEFNIQDKKENEDVFIDLKKEEKALKDVINYQCINADRDVSNKESGKPLSLLSSKIYRKIEADERQKKGIEGFKNALSSTDKELGKIYENIFQDVIKKVKDFGGIKPDDTKIKITSTLQHKELLEGNTTVMYEHDDKHDLPESYNGLGYMNLISMIFEIEILLNEFKKKKDEKPADINILFIEEPEAHTHPQMQYIFINNIKTLLKDGISRDDGEKRDLQYIISTHSSHIVAESDFDDIKYLKIENNGVIANNLKNLKEEYKDEQQNYKFLKQYLTLHRAELFFADKAIFIEGDTERILLPAMMKKIDQDDPKNPLLSQNISIIEVGNYSQIFEKFIDFIGVKSLIITDIDSVTGDIKKCRVADKDATITTNASLKFFYGSNKLEDFKCVALENMALKKNSKKKWVKNKNGHLLCVYQTEEENSKKEKYHARSFEDSFFHINRQFITDNIDNKNNFKSLKNKNCLKDTSKDAYDLSEECINKKPAFAIEILLNSETDDKGKQFTNWKIPDYIKKGLLWLKKDQN
ncbi:MAG: ATP-dependent endonuclease [Deltaproteobacteria bacterium]|nr:ATP-dependent endonuclease [Deltaproteobacteria bacterium]